MTRDVEGHVLSETYPNGMTEKRSYNLLGEPISLEYVKTTHCTTSCTWYTDSIVPYIDGQWASQTSTFGKENYAYDEMERLSEVQETPAGEGCTSRLYAYEEAGDRTSETTRPPATGGACATEGGTSQSYTYDTADRLDEEGVSYDPFGNTTTLPAADAGGTALTSSYYVNNTLATQKQNGEEITYNLDPAGRPREAVATGTTNVSTISHYAGPSQAAAWTITSTGSWTRNIEGVADGLAAIQTNGETPIIQLVDLHGDIIATAALNEETSKLIPATETSEYGVPHSSITKKYAWLGTDKVPTELPTGIINMGARTYIPALGRFEQTDPQPGGSINPYAYTNDDPISQADPTGEAYNFENAQAGEAETGLAEEYAGPGAIYPPPVNMQVEEEFNAHPPWSASDAYGTVLWDLPTPDAVETARARRASSESRSTSGKSRNGGAKPRRAGNASR